ncbi:hypothetical protein LOD99_12068 [Oopsacas minuta]|uniref:Uncharacterized protein n=1 Tax=Oopsacas minuta TaxID=111878 RepID=A0AAV7JIH3_9METZ|nr:hypothetical protein LOD99_12068 [Oopsacas minuta]
MGLLEVYQDLFITPTIICDLLLGVDFIMENKLELDFNKDCIQSHQLSKAKMLGACERDREYVYVSTEEDQGTIIVYSTTDDDELKEGCMVPMYIKMATYEIPPIRRLQ